MNEEEKLKGISGCFIQKYYNLMILEPRGLHNFYEPASTLSWISGENSYQNIRGKELIKNTFYDMKLNNCRVEVLKYNAQFSSDISVFILVNGRYSLDDQPWMMFVQTFVLAKSQLTEGNYFILNDIFRDLETFQNPNNQGKGIDVNVEVKKRKLITTGTGTPLPELHHNFIQQNLNMRNFGESNNGLPIESSEIEEEKVESQENEVVTEEFEKNTIETEEEKDGEEIEEENKDPVEVEEVEGEVEEVIEVDSVDGENVVEVSPATTPVKSEKEEEEEGERNVELIEDDGLEETITIEEEPPRKSGSKPSYASIVGDRIKINSNNLEDKIVSPERKPRKVRKTKVTKSEVTQLPNQNKRRMGENNRRSGGGRYNRSYPKRKIFGVYVSNVENTTTNKELEEVFKPYGKIIDIHNKSGDKKIAFVFYDSEESVEKAVKQSGKIELKKLKLNIERRRNKNSYLKYATSKFRKFK